MKLRLREEQRLAVERQANDLRALGGFRGRDAALDDACGALQAGYERALLCARGPEDPLWAELVRLAAGVRALASPAHLGEAARAFRRLEQLVAENADVAEGEAEAAVLGLVV